MKLGSSQYAFAFGYLSLIIDVPIGRWKSSCFNWLFLWFFFSWWFTKLHRPSSIYFVNACLSSRLIGVISVYTIDKSPPMEKASLLPEEVTTDNSFTHISKKFDLVFCVLLILCSYIMYRFFAVQRDAQCRSDEYTVYSHPVGCYRLLVAFFSRSGR